jgi:hypothetical protein
MKESAGGEIEAAEDLAAEIASIAGDFLNHGKSPAFTAWISKLLPLPSR